MLFDLTIKVADSIRSSQLAKSISVVVSKLDEMLESKIVRLAHTVGQSLAEKISAVAKSWGYVAAGVWASDRYFAVYLAVMHANK